MIDNVFRGLGCIDFLTCTIVLLREALLVARKIRNGDDVVYERLRDLALLQSSQYGVGRRSSFEYWILFHSLSWFRHAQRALDLQRRL